jgi:hypothetical protein
MTLSPSVLLPALFIMESSASKVSRLSEARMARYAYSDQRKMLCVSADLLSFLALRHLQ